MAGKRINLSDLAVEPPLEGAKVPTIAGSGSRTARVEQVAPNPRNSRKVEDHPERIVSLADSIQQHGQLQPCTVVTRDVFLAIFPEHAAETEGAEFVQVTGARRRAAVIRLGLPTLEITVKNSVAESRATFTSATAAENIEREDYDPIEEALAVQALVNECQSGKAAAEQLARTPGWVSQRLNLLKLEPELQAALRSAEIPLREVRDLHNRSREEQLQAFSAWREVVKARQRADEKRLQACDEAQSQDGSKPTATRTRRSPVALALHRLGGTPTKIAEVLRKEFSPEDRRALAEELLREDST